MKQKGGFYIIKLINNHCHNNMGKLKEIEVFINKTGIISN